MIQATRKTSSQARAFTLIEVMMAGSMLVIGAAAVLTSYYTIINAAELQRHLNPAIQITQSTVEEVLAADNQAPLLGPNEIGRKVDANGMLLDVNSPQDATRTYKVIITKEPGTPGPGLVRVTVTTRWKDLQGQVHEVRTTVVRPG